MEDLSEIKKPIPLERLNQLIESDPFVYRFFLMRFNHYARGSKNQKIRLCEIREVVNRSRKSVVSESKELYERLKGIVKEDGITDELKLMLRDLKSVFDILKQRRVFERGLDKDDFSRTMDAKPKTSTEYFSRAHFLIKFFPYKTQEIVDDYTRVLELSENWYTARANRIVWLGRLNGFDQGLILECTKTRTVIPSCSLTYSAEAMINFRLKNYEQSIRLSDVAIKLLEASHSCESDRYVETISHEIGKEYANKAICYFRLEQTDESLRNLKKSLSFRPNYANSFYVRATVYFQSGNLKLAVSDYSSTLRVEPGHFKSLYWRGLMYEKLGEYDNAISDFTQNIERVKPFEKSWSYRYRGDCFLEKEMFENAILDYTEAAKLGNWNCVEKRVNAVEKLKEKIMKM